MQLSDEQFSLLNDYVEQTLDEADRASVEAMLQQHPHLAEVVEAMRRDKAALVLLGEQSMDEQPASMHAGDTMDLTSAALAQVDADDSNPIVGRIDGRSSAATRFWLMLGGLSAAAVLLIVAGLVFQYINMASAPTPSSQPGGTGLADTRSQSDRFEPRPLEPSPSPAASMAMAMEAERTDDSELASAKPEASARKRGLSETSTVADETAAVVVMNDDDVAPELAKLDVADAPRDGFRQTRAPSRQVMRIVTADPVDSNSRLGTWAVNNSGVEVIEQRLEPEGQARSSLRVPENQVPALMSQLAMETTRTRVMKQRPQQPATVVAKKESRADVDAVRETGQLAMRRQAAAEMKTKLADEVSEAQVASGTLSGGAVGQSDGEMASYQADKTIQGDTTPADHTASWQNFEWGTVLQNQLPLEANRRLALARDRESMEIDVIFVSPSSRMGGYFGEAAESPDVSSNETGNESR